MKIYVNRHGLHIEGTEDQIAMIARVCQGAIARHTNGTGQGMAGQLNGVENLGGFVFPPAAASIHVTVTGGPKRFTA